MALFYPPDATVVSKRHRNGLNRAFTTSRPFQRETRAFEVGSCTAEPLVANDFTSTPCLLLYASAAGHGSDSEELTAYAYKVQPGFRGHPPGSWRKPRVPSHCYDDAAQFREAVFSGVSPGRVR